MNVQVFLMFINSYAKMLGVEACLIYILERFFWGLNKDGALESC